MLDHIENHKNLPSYADEANGFGSKEYRRKNKILKNANKLKPSSGF
jgi:hypothetical protein